MVCEILSHLAIFDCSERPLGYRREQGCQVITLGLGIHDKTIEFNHQVTEFHRITLRMAIIFPVLASLLERSTEQIRNQTLQRSF